MAIPWKWIRALPSQLQDLGTMGSETSRPQLLNPLMLSRRHSLYEILHDFRNVQGTFQGQTGYFVFIKPQTDRKEGSGHHCHNNPLHDVNLWRSGNECNLTTLRITLGKRSHAYDNTYNVKDFKGRVVDGNATPNVFCNYSATNSRAATPL